MQSNPMSQGQPKKTTRANIDNRAGKIPKPVVCGSEDPNYDMFVQKKVRIKLYQEIPEIFEALTTNQIFALRSEITRHIAECLIDTVNSDIEDVYLTDASTSARLGWFVAETLLKVGLNMASQAAAGIVLDSLHEALNTHGTSPFEFDKQMQEAQFTDGSSGNVVTRRAQPWNASNDITFDVFARQVLSDFGDETYEATTSLIGETTVGKAKSKMSQFFAWREQSKHGKAFRTSRNHSALEQMLMPIEILSWRMTVVEQLINAVVFEAMSAQAHSGTTPTDDEIGQAVAAAKARLKRLNIHGYITYLNDLANTYIPKLSKRKLFKVILAETMVENAPSVLKGSQKLSKSLWLFLAKKQLIAKRKEGTLKDTKTHTALDLYSLEGMSSGYSGKKTDDKLWKQVNEAYNYNRLATTSNKEFGETSGLACFLASEMMLRDNEINRKRIIQGVHQDSSYRNYTRFLSLSSSDVDFLEEKQRTGELKLSIAVEARFYPE